MSYTLNYCKHRLCSWPIVNSRNGRLQSFGCHGKELGQYDKNTIVNVWTLSIHVTKAQKKHANNQDIFLRTHEKKPHREELDERQKNGSFAR